MRHADLFRTSKRVTFVLVVLGALSATTLQPAQARRPDQPPTITGFSPTSGQVGTSVTISGTNFTKVSAVAFNGTQATYRVRSSTEITTSVPSGATTGPITVQAASGTAVSSSSFTVAAPPQQPPTITGFAPSQGPVGATVTISGANFSGATAVAFNATTASYSVNSSSQITAVVPSAATSGPITVTTSAGQATSASSFTVTTASQSPTITGFSPSKGGAGTKVTISGSNFSSATKVAFNGAAASYSVNSSTQITATVPTGASTGPLGVTTNFGSASSASSFTVTSTAPITITSGGTYSGQWISTSSTPAVQINTTAPVTISYSDVQNLSGGDLIDATSGANVTIVHTTVEGGNGRAFYAYKLKSLTIQNCTITETSGIRLDGAADSATVEITQNKVRNIQSASYNTVFAQLANVTTAQIDISWNEVINTYQQSGVEDNISIYASAYAEVHDNYIQGAYPSSPSAPFTGSGIMIDYLGAHDNNVYSNQVVDTTNAGIGIAGGWNNKVHDNRMVSDGKLDDGTPLAAANVGLYVWNMYSDPNWANNDAYANTVGWLNASGNWAAWWLPDCSGSCSNTSYPGTVNHAAEQAEYQIWLAKLLANGITPGA